MLTAERLLKVARNAHFRVAFLVGCVLTNSCGTSDNGGPSHGEAQAGVAGFVSGGSSSSDGGSSDSSGGTVSAAGSNGGVAGQNSGGDSGSPSGGTHGSSEAGSGAGGSLNTVGGTSGAATGGDTGTGGAPNLCSGAESRYCDDGNSCTADSCDPQLGCLHVANADGTQCDDHDICTRNDRCLAGACVGQVVEQKAEILGQLNTIGGYEELEYPAILPFQGLSVALTENLALFAEPKDPGMRLALVRVEPSSLQVLDSVFTYASVVQSGGINVWSTSLGTHLVRLSSSRVAVVTTRHDIEVYDVVGDKLVFRAYRYLLEDKIGDDVVLDAKGRGNNLWVMASMRLTGYEVAPDGTLSPRAQFPIETTVGRFTVAEDMNSLYVGGQLGIFRIDVTDPLHPVTDVTPVIPRVASRRIYNLDIRDGYLLLHEEVAFGAPGDARVFRIADWKEAAAFPASSLLEPRFTAPTGIAFIDGGLLVQRIQYGDDGKPQELSAELYALDDSGAVLKDKWKYRDLSAVGNTDQWQPLAPVATGRLAIIGPTRRLIWTEGGKISEIKGVQQGSLDRVLPGGAGRVFAYGSESTHLIDISNPNVPTVLAGGLLAPEESGLIRVSLPLTAQETPSLLNVSPDSLDTLNGRWRLGSGRVTQFESSDTFAPRVAGSVSIPGGTAQAVSGGLLFQVTDANDGTWLLKTFDLPRSAQKGTALSPIETQTLVGTWSVESGAKLVVDASAHRLLLASTDTTGKTTFVDWFTRNNGRWALAGSVTLPIGSDIVVALRGNLAVIGGYDYAENDAITLLELVADQVKIQRTRLLPYYTGELSLTGRILGFDGSRLYIVLREDDVPMNSTKVAVHALALDTLETVERYELPEIPGSMIAVDDHLVFGARTSLTIASPGCVASHP